MQPAPDPVARRRVRGLCLALAGIALLGSAVFAARSPVATGGDAAAYALAARYDPLADNFDNPSHGWGYPGVIRGISPLVRDEYLAGQLVSIAACGAFVAAASALALRHLPFGAGALAGLLLATDPTVLRLGGAAMSDMLFAALESGALWLAFSQRMRRESLLAAGAIAAFACFVRGNGIVLLPLLPLLLWASPRGGARAGLFFLAGAAACWALFAALFAARGLAVRSLLRPGAGELAFAALDRSGTWLDRAGWEARFPSYLGLFAHHGREMAISAGRSLLHLHDWWLIPTLGLFGVFTIPGLVLLLRRPAALWLELALPLLALWGSFLWSARFRDPRHLLAEMPLLLAASVVGVGLFPRRRRVPFLAKPLPLRAAALALATTLSLGRSAHALYAVVAHGGSELGALEQRDAGLWLREHGARPGDRVASTRLTTAYYARLYPVDYRDVFGPDSAQLSPDDVCRRLEENGVRWLVWVEGHGQFEHPGLTWLEREASFASCALVFREGHVSVWRVGSDEAPG